MKLATTTGDFAGYTRSQTESIQYIHAAGFRYLDYNFGTDYARRNGIYGDDFQKYVEEVRSTVDSLGMKFVQSHSPMGKPIAPDNTAFLADTIRCVEACGAIGIPSIVVHSGYDVGLTKEEAFEKNKAFFMPILEAGERHDVDILVENFNKMSKPDVYWIDNAPDLLALIEYVDHPRFHAVWDTGHGNMQEMSQDEALRILGKHVRALHVQDNMGNSDSHFAPYFGTLNLDSLMHGLIDIDYKGYFTFEAGNILQSEKKRRVYEADTRLFRIPLSLRLEAEKFLYQIGKTVLEAYNCFEE